MVLRTRGSFVYFEQRTDPCVGTADENAAAWVEHACSVYDLGICISSVYVLGMCICTRVSTRVCLHACACFSLHAPSFRIYALACVDNSLLRLLLASDPGVPDTHTNTHADTHATCRDNHKLPTRQKKKVRNASDASTAVVLDMRGPGMP